MFSTVLSENFFFKILVFSYPFTCDVELPSEHYTWQNVQEQHSGYNCSLQYAMRTLPFWSSSTLFEGDGGGNTCVFVTFGLSISFKLNPHMTNSGNEVLDSTTLHAYYTIPQHREFDGFIVKYMYWFYCDYIVFLIRFNLSFSMRTPWWVETRQCSSPPEFTAIMWETEH